MSHNFVKQSDGSKVCSCCGDERGTDADRDCPHPLVAQPGNYPAPVNFIELCPPHLYSLFHLLLMNSLYLGENMSEF